MEDRCVSCGAVIPEGTMVCSKCMVSKDHIQNHYEQILAMSLTELAVFLCENTKDCEECAGCEYCTTWGGHANGMITWLKSKSEG